MFFQTPPLLLIGPTLRQGTPPIPSPGTVTMGEASGLDSDVPMVHTESETQGGKFPGEGEEGRDFPGEEDDIPWEENAFWNDLYQWRGGRDWKLDDLHSRLSEMEQRPPIPFEVVVDEKLSIFESDVLRKNLELQSEMEGHVLGRLQEEGQKIISNARAAVNEFLQRCQEEGLALKAMANG